MNFNFEIIAEGVRLFNEGNYFEAHDYFEDLWMDARGEEKIFLQALIQLSVASFHLINNNIKGAKSQFSKCLRKLKNYPDKYCFINVKDLIRQIEILFGKININTERKFLIEIPLFEK